ncbi:MAG: META domain-containing protein [Microbacterium sp.]
MKMTTLAPAGALLLTALAFAGCASGPGSSSGSTPDSTPDIAALASGTWQSSEAGEPALKFADDGTFTGSDGCNGLSGNYKVDGGTVKITYLVGTQMACQGVDQWLSKVSSVSIDGAELQVYNKDGDLIGTLANDS